MLLDIQKDIIHNLNFDADMQRRGHHAITKAHIDGLYHVWKSAQTEFEAVAHELNAISKHFTPDKAIYAKELSHRRNELDHIAKQHRATLDHYVLNIPNLLDARVPNGGSSDDNVEIYRYNEPSPATGRHHEDILVENGTLLKEEGVYMSGSRFTCLRGAAAHLERKLIQYAMNKCVEHGFVEMSVPILVRDEALLNAGLLPKFDGEYFRIDSSASCNLGTSNAGSVAQDHHQCLIPTGEVSLVNVYAKKLIQYKDLPIKMVTVTPCFRKEAGSLGRDTKGLIRLHQFNKVEMFAVSSPDNSDKTHHDMLRLTQSILEHLQLPYRVVALCAGDIGFTAARSYDIEVWMPGQGKYVEVASISNCWEFQSRRANIKCTDAASGMNRYTHTLNGTAIAAGRIIAALAEHGRDFVDVAGLL
jgi:seryl-tRNA synthetase